VTFVVQVLEVFDENRLTRDDFLVSTDQNFASSSTMHRTREH
jgi:hypothetical protein